ncbi:acyltransferase family protein [Massilia sp. erpn]|uniref:acyltransferase family protein n=1 Tax=Massilia sp. erpn TaxID=2738142 RepID=UPI00210361F5|nr:acyltransferase family protein [Massilia sp. erpn]UTY60950.1 acyltransferase [Massilia sp. erpn]
MLCHAQLPGFAGGFVGVDVFFAISGFVVTQLILREQDAGRFTLAAFYARRLKRLAPALYLVLAALFLFCLHFVFPEDTLSLLKNSGAQALFWSNIYLSRQSGYFDLSADKQPLLHTWSLSLEEQFYLVLPLLLVLMRKWSWRRKFAVLALLALASLLYSQQAAAHFQAKAYYQMHARAFEFMAGMLLAMAPQLPAAWKRLHAAGLILGLAIIGYCVFTYTGATPMPGLAAALPCAGALLIMAGGPRPGYMGTLLGNELTAYLGRLSYSMYLWHWPLLYAARRLQLDTHWSLLWALAASVPLAMLTYHCVEQPMRQAQWRHRKTWLLLFVLPVAVISGLIGLAKVSDNFSRWQSDAVRSDFAAAGRTVFNLPRGQRCWSKVGLTRAEECSVGDLASANKAVFLGDSHAYQLIDFVDGMGKDFGLSIHDMTFTMCPPVENTPARAGDPAFHRHAAECREHNRLVMAHVMAQPQIKTVIMSAVWQIYTHGAPRPEATPNVHGFMPQEFEQLLDTTIGKLEAAGKRVILFDDVPGAPPPMDNCVSNKLYLPGAGASDCSYDAAIAAQEHVVALQVLNAVLRRHPAVELIHSYDVLCSNGRCPLAWQGIPLYGHNDPGHLGAGGSAILYPAYRARHPGELEGIFSN